MKKKNNQIIVTDQTDDGHDEQSQAFSLASLRGRLESDLAEQLEIIWPHIEDAAARSALVNIETIFGSLFDVVEVTEKTLGDASRVFADQQSAMLRIKDQRDHALAELEALATAISDLDITNPLVKRAYDDILAQIRQVAGKAG